MEHSDGYLNRWIRDGKTSPTPLQAVYNADGYPIEKEGSHVQGHT